MSRRAWIQRQERPVCCSVLQCAAMCCSVLQCVECDAVRDCWFDVRVRVCVLERLLQCVAVCCSVLQCVAVCCSVLQCVVMYCSVSMLVLEYLCLSVSWDACCRVLQCVVVHCSALQCVIIGDVVLGGFISLDAHHSQTKETRVIAFLHSDASETMSLLYMRPHTRDLIGLFW